MNILVTGGAGKIGSLVVKKLLEQNHDVKVLVLPDDPLEKRLNDFQVDIFYGNLEDYNSLISAVKGVEVVYHFGARLSRGNTNMETFETNIRGTFNLLEALNNSKNNLKKFIFGSSDAIYYDSFGNTCYSPIDEYHPNLTGSYYGLSKQIGENMCINYGDKYEYETICVRIPPTIKSKELIDPNSNISERFYVNAKIRAMNRIKNQSEEIIRAINVLEEYSGEKKLFVAYDEKGRSSEGYIADVRDIANGFLLLLDNFSLRSQIFNFGPPSSCDYEKVVKYISKKTNIPYVEVELPFGIRQIEMSIAKARCNLNYQPKWDIFSMIDFALDKNS